MPGAGSDGAIEQAYTGYDASINAIVVAYRGTGQVGVGVQPAPRRRGTSCRDPTEESSIKNWILDLQADHTSTTYPHCDCKVEAGFYEGTLACPAVCVRANI